MALLEVRDLHAGYGHAHVLQGVSISVEQGEIVSLFGRNGAGKTTTLRTVMGWIAPWQGSVELEGRSIGGLSADRIARAGVGLIPEDRRVFPTLSVEENLSLGRYQAPSAGRGQHRQRMQYVYELFPRLAERRSQGGRTLSGGEQQMLAIARALVGSPRVILVDEPSEGLAPKIVEEIFAVIARLRDEGIAVLLVEQNVTRAAPLSDRCYVLEKGRTVAEGAPAELLADEEVRKRLSV